MKKLLNILLLVATGCQTADYTRKEIQQANKENPAQRKMLNFLEPI
jgi:hypothetical protein